MEQIPFNPLPPDWEGHPMPPSVPAGMQLRLSRAKVIPGQEDQAEAWMEMLHRRYDEAVDTLARERAAFESIFFSREPDGSTWLYHLELYGDSGSGLDPEGSDVDREHVDFGRRVKLPGWEELEPKFLLAPEHIRAAFESWCADGTK